MSVTFTDHSKEASEAMDKAVSRALKAIGMTAEAYAKEKTPVDTGRLRNSITHVEKDAEKASYIGTAVEYGPYVELGAQGRAPVHMLRNAATKHTEEYKGLVESALKGK